MLEGVPTPQTTPDPRQAGQFLRFSRKKIAAPMRSPGRQRIMHDSGRVAHHPVSLPSINTLLLDPDRSSAFPADKAKAPAAGARAVSEAEAPGQRHGRKARGSPEGGDSSIPPCVIADRSDIRQMDLEAGSG